MKILMFVRDALPPARVDVKVLFDIELRNLGFETDYVGVRRGTGPSQVDPAHGAVYAYAAPETLRPIDVVRAFMHDISVAFGKCAQYDLLLVRDRPIEAALLFLIARLRGARTAYWMSFPMSLGDRVNAVGHWHRGARTRAVLVWLRGGAGSVIKRFATLPLAEHIFVQSDEMKRVLQSRGVPEQKMTAVPMGVDSALIERLPALPPASVRGDRMVYLGSLNRARRLDFLLHVLRSVRVAVPQAGLLMIGSAEHPEELQELQGLAVSLGVADAVEFVGTLPRLEALILASRCAVGVSPIPRGPVFDVSSPTKVLEYFALGLPVVANDIPDQQYVLQASGGGICVDDNIERFAGAVVELLQDPERAASCGRDGRAFVLAQRSYRRLARDVAAHLSPLRQRRYMVRHEYRTPRT